MRKYEIARLLAKRFGYTSYLEICTATTGCTFNRVDKQQFTRQVRVMYRRPAGFSDGGPIDYSSEGDSSEELLAEILRSGEKFDLVFVDPFHTYEASLRDLVLGLQLTKDDGLLLMHDCLPPNEQCTAPKQNQEEWCGLTFEVFLDVVLSTSSLHYCTVDTDYGCGIISKQSRKAALSTLYPNGAQIAEWQRLRSAQKFPFFAQYKARLLRLISPEEFQVRLNGGGKLEIWKSRLAEFFSKITVFRRVYLWLRTQLESWHLTRQSTNQGVR